MSVEARLKRLGFDLPKVPTPVAEYVPAKRVGEFVWVSGQGPICDGKPLYVGRVGEEVSLQDAYKAARLCCLNCLAAIKAVIGSLEVVDSVVFLAGFVNSASNFSEHSKVVNGASDLLVQLFEERGRHARIAVGVSSLPGNISVEISMIVRVRGQEGGGKEKIAF